MKSVKKSTLFEHRAGKAGGASLLILARNAGF